MSDIIFGKNSVQEAFKENVEIEKVFLLATMHGEYEVLVRKYCKENNISLAKVPEQKLNELSKFKAHQGVVAMISPIKYITYQNLIEQSMNTGRSPNIVIIDNVSDVRNIGAIARSAYFFGADGIIITGNFAGSISEDTVKASAGALLKLPIARASSLFTLISDLQNQGISVVATALKESSVPDQVDLTQPIAFLVGSEDKGLHYKVLDVVDHTIKINSPNDFDSLNVSVTAGILLYEINRQRNI